VIRYDPKEDGSEDGICSYCKTIDKYKNVISNFGKRSDLLQARINLYRDKGEYDCIVGFSGGKDSTYVIYRLKSHYGARVLAFTLDNSFLNDYARENIERVVKEFEIDHLWVRPDNAVLRTAYRTSLNDECWPCSACFYFLNATPWKLAYERKIPYIVNGRIPEQILRKPDDDVFESPFSQIADNLVPYDEKRTFHYAKNRLSGLDEFGHWLMPDKAIRQLASKTVRIPSDFNIPDDFAPEEISFFLYEEHNESQIMDTLEQNTSWVRPDQEALLGHADCEVHHAAGYMYNKMYGLPLSDYEISGLVRHNKLSRDEALKVIKDTAEELSVYPEDSMKVLSEVSGISQFCLRHMHLKIKLKNFIKKIIGRK
jgi:hypothetical protein